MKTIWICINIHMPEKFILTDKNYLQAGLHDTAKCLLLLKIWCSVGMN